MDIEGILAKLSLKEKCSLLSGKDYWLTEENPRVGIESMMMTDGPHGLRKQTGDTAVADIGSSVPATCFPTASASACSFDIDLLRKMGEALGEECRAQDVGVVLGPGINMKRSPLCGRNFEYFSEDPLLAGQLAAAMIEGVQSQGVGTSLKHFCANNQELDRMTVDCAIDERTLHEIYLKGFEIAVRKAHPWTIMTAYNKLNGAYCSQNEDLLHLAREQWGFDGAFITDWGALSESVPSVDAGLDLVMPGPRPDHSAKLLDAVNAGDLEETKIDEAARHVLELIARHQAAAATPYENDLAAHADLARHIAEDSAVLLENDGILPLAKDSKIAVIGSFAEQPRYQGAGSSLINPARLDNPLDAIRKIVPEATFARGYSPHHADTTEALFHEAESDAAAADIALLFIGLPDTYESEGFDRTTISIPKSHIQLLERVCSANRNTVVILQGGAPMDVSWRAMPRALLLSYLAGESGGQAIANIVFGDVNPSGKLAETWPNTIQDTPCYDFYPARRGAALYRESIFTGYRYYDAVNQEVAYPFGYGLSYTSFEYESLQVSSTDNTVTLSFEVANTGTCEGREVAQVYVAPQDPGVFKAVQELAGFSKIALAPNETKTVSFSLDKTAFSHWDIDSKAWAVETGTYELRIGTSSRDIRLHATVERTGIPKAVSQTDLEQPYHHVSPYSFSTEAFAHLYDGDLPQPLHKGRPFTIDSTLRDMDDQTIARLIQWQAKKTFDKIFQDNTKGIATARVMLDEMPVRGFMLAGFDMSAIEALVLFANGHRVEAIRRFKKKYRDRF